MAFFENFNIETPSDDHSLAGYFTTFQNEVLNFKFQTLNVIVIQYTRSLQKIRGLFELRGSSWFQEKPRGVARFVQIG